MTITEHTTITEIAGALPGSVRIFQRHGIDFCCGGKRPIGAVCEEQGLSFGQLAREIEVSAAGAAPDAREWSTESLGALIAHIVATYHDQLREELPRLEAMAAKVARVHGAKDASLARIHTIVADLSADLLSHMRKEELILFPAIDALEVTGRQAMLLSAPIAVMEHEHDHAGRLLTELRHITSGYQPPEWACATFRALFDGLAEFESTMHVHVHLENNILFPRAVALAESH